MANTRIKSKKYALNFDCVKNSLNINIWNIINVSNSIIRKKNPLLYLWSIGRLLNVSIKFVTKLEKCKSSSWSIFCKIKEPAISQQNNDKIEKANPGKYNKIKLKSFENKTNVETFYILNKVNSVILYAPSDS